VGVVLSELHSTQPRDNGIENCRPRVAGNTWLQVSFPVGTFLCRERFGEVIPCITDLRIQKGLPDKICILGFHFALYTVGDDEKAETLKAGGLGVRPRA